VVPVSDVLRLNVGKEDEPETRIVHNVTAAPAALDAGLKTWVF
jgi:hypothetical protein